MKIYVESSRSLRINVDKRLNYEPILRTMEIFNPCSKHQGNLYNCSSCSGISKYPTLIHENGLLK